MAYDDKKLLAVFGTDELIQAFKNLDTDVSNKLVQTSLRKGSKLIIDEVKGKLINHRKSGRLINSFTSSFKKQIKQMIVGASKRKGGYHAHLLEEGTKERFYTTKRGNKKSTGKVKGIYYFKTTINSKGKEVFRIIGDEMKRLLLKHIKNNSMK